MKRFNLSDFVRRTIDTLRDFPMEAVAGVLFFVTYLNSQYDWTKLASSEDMLLFFPIVTTVIYCCGRWFTYGNRWRWIYYVALPVMYIALVVCPLDNFVDTPAFGFTMLLTAFLFVGHKAAADNRIFSRKALQLILNGAFAAVAALAVELVVIIVLASIRNLFGVEINYMEEQNTLLFLLFVVVPLLFCALQKVSDSEKWKQPGRFVRILLDYVLNPGILIYTVVLYAYLIRILFAWELPNGSVAAMVTAFVIASFAGQMSQYVVEKPLYGWYYRRFTWIALPLLALFWTGTIVRIAQYGFTESRAYLVLAGVLMTVFVVMLLFKGIARFRTMLLVASAGIVVLTYIPGISAASIGIYAQSHRVKSLARQLDLLDASTGKLKNTAEFVAADSVRLADARQLDAAYDYLKGALGTKAVVDRYGQNALRLTVKTAASYGFWSLQCPEEVDVEDYRRMLLDCSLDTAGIVTHGDSVVARLDFVRHFSAHKSELDSVRLSGDGVLGEETFKMRSGNTMVVFHAISYDNANGYRFTDTYDIDVFTK